MQLVLKPSMLCLDLYALKVLSSLWSFSDLFNLFFKQSEALWSNFWELALAKSVINYAYFLAPGFENRSSQYSESFYGYYYLGSCLRSSLAYYKRHTALRFLRFIKFPINIRAGKLSKPFYSQFQWLMNKCVRSKKSKTPSQDFD